jgi:hypothetical protein
LDAKLQSQEFAQVAQSLRETGFNTTVDLCRDRTRVQPSDLAPWLADVQINYDRNLRLQYLAGMGLEPVSERPDLLRDDLLRREVPGQPVYWLARTIAGTAAGVRSRAQRALTLMIIRTKTVAILVLTAAFAVVVSPRHAAVLSAAPGVADTLPERLTDQEFWALSQDSSEPNGQFQSDNLVSNEQYLQYVIPDLVRRVPSGGVYLGVGPEQNFTYIAAVKPKMVFITDVRRGNLCMHLMYKAIFELSKDRADFVELLFNKKRPAGLSEKSTAHDLSYAFWDVLTSSEDVYRANLKRIEDHLTQTRHLPLGRDDLAGIEYIYSHFWWDGMRINYNASNPNYNPNAANQMAMYGDLMLHTDQAGTSWYYLNSEESYRTLKDLEERNLFVPVVGNFAGPKALRAVGKYVRDHGATVSAMYLSNVEQYLNQDGIWPYFCANVASMPLDARSTFIRSARAGGAGGSGLMNYLGAMQSETASCGRAAARAVQ